MEEFIARWRDTEASERANKDSFLKELCRALGVREPDGKRKDPELNTYVFEADAVLYDEDGRRRVGRMDLYKKGSFVLEAKQGSTSKGKGRGTARRNAPGWAIAMNDAFGQALGYAKTIDTPPPFVVVADIGYCFDLYACFDGSGSYHSFPNNQKNRLYFKDLAQHADLLRSIWLDPFALDPARRSQAVTVEVSKDLAELARELERKHPPDQVAKFLMRCVFCMFAEDIGLLRGKLFSEALEKHWLPEPESFKEGVEALWDAMNEGKKFFLLGKLLRFNGGLFANPEALPLNTKQLKILLSAAKKAWSDVQPAIFGTLIERALDEKDRHNLGAHFTPGSYVERLLRHVIEEPLRERWDGVRAQIRQLVPPNQEPKRADLKKAQEIVAGFHKTLCNTTVLDPACGSGNFLYLALNMFKRLESEVVAMLNDLGVRQLQFDEHTVTPRQFKGIEIRPQSKEITELVLWIGYLQWHNKMYGQTVNPPEPILRDYKNIERRDALLAERNYGFSRSRNTRQEWPQANYIVGNPPFIGNKRMRLVLTDEYVESLRLAHPDVPETADYVMYWWHHAARQLAQRHTDGFGFITTNSITQSFNRRVVANALEADREARIAFVVPDHPWVDSATGAAVRIAMSVLDHRSGPGLYCTVASERTQDDGTVDVVLKSTVGQINAGLSVGSDNLSSAAKLMANENLCLQGCKLVQPRGEPGFELTPEERTRFQRKKPSRKRFMPRYVTGNDLTKAPAERYVIDFCGLSESEAREQFPDGYQLLLDRVKPFRDKNRRKTRSEKWWLFGENAPKLRRASEDLDRFIATSEVAKHRVFTFLDLPGTLADGSLAAIASDDAFVLGVLSSSVHLVWARRQGGTLEDRPRYQNGPCFETFAFPECSAAQTAKIRKLAEELEGHRKRQFAAHPCLTVTSIYNVLEKLRGAEELDHKEQEVHEQGLVSVLKKVHEELDAAVLDAYGWGRNLSAEDILRHLFALNQERSAEEAIGHIRWLRPQYQQAARGSATKVKRANSKQPNSAQLALEWPESLPEQVTTVRTVVGGSSGALSAQEVAAACLGASTTKVLSVLETLEALGHLVSFKDGEKRWASVARIANDHLAGPGLRKASSRPPRAQVG